MNDWQRALTTQVARNIEHHRAVQGITRTDLAKRCTALGLPTKRPALAALLDEHRQTVTLQELSVLAEALGTSVAELIVPIHTSGQTITGPVRHAHALHAAEHLFAMRSGRAPNPYLPYQRCLRAADRFERANRRLAEISHDLAVGLQEAHEIDGRPHPASEILAAEAALSRLINAEQQLYTAGLLSPLEKARWGFLDASTSLDELPVLSLLPKQGRTLMPMTLYRLHANDLPSSRVIT